MKHLSSYTNESAVNGNGKCNQVYYAKTDNDEIPSRSRVEKKMK